MKDGEYVRTDGLFSLLTKKDPKSFSREVLEDYKQMLVETGAHLNKNRTLRHCRSKKYTEIIKKIFGPTSTPYKTPGYSRNESMNESFFDIFKTPSEKTDENLKDSSYFDSSASFFLEQKGEGYHSHHLENKKHIKGVEDGSNCHLIFWDDPNQLVQRLYLLYLSKQAGNSNVSNEIISIEQELRQGGYIY